MRREERLTQIISVLKERPRAAKHIAKKVKISNSTARMYLRILEKDGTIKRRIGSWPVKFEINDNGGK